MFAAAEIRHLYRAFGVAAFNSAYAFRVCSANARASSIAAALETKPKSM